MISLLMCGMPSASMQAVCLTGSEAKDTFSRRSQSKGLNLWRRRISPRAQTRRGPIIGRSLLREASPPRSSNSNSPHSTLSLPLAALPLSLRLFLSFASVLAKERKLLHYFFLGCLTGTQEDQETCLQLAFLLFSPYL